MERPAARRIAADTEVSVLHLEDLTKDAMRGAFASWAADHAAASVLRAQSSWSSFFDFLVAEDLLEGNPMAAVAKPRAVVSAPRAIRAPDAASRLLGVATVVDQRGRHPWPARDLALVAIFCVTGIRESEAVALSICPLRGARRLAWLAVWWWCRCRSRSESVGEVRSGLAGRAPVRLP